MRLKVIELESRGREIRTPADAALETTALTWLSYTPMALRYVHSTQLYRLPERRRPDSHRKAWTDILS